MSRKPLAVILSGGAGDRLYPLTAIRSKPAVPIGGKYRLIDIAISNCIASEIFHLFVLTQFNSGSLNRHVTGRYRMSPFLDGFVEVLAATMTPNNPNWHQGGADAVRRNIWYIKRAAESLGVTDVLILSGDHLYRMDYGKLIDAHRERRADVTVAVLPVGADQVENLGVVQVDQDLRIRAFHEKPSPADLTSSVHLPGPQWEPVVLGEDRPFLGSMGIYVFRLAMLDELLADESYNSFGADLLPTLVPKCKACAYPFFGYWESLGSIGDLYRANLAMCGPEPQFDFFPHQVRFFTQGRTVPAAKINGAKLRSSLISEGCIIEQGARISDSVIGMRAFVGADVSLRGTVVTGANSYEPIRDRIDRLDRGEVPAGIGAGSVLDRCLLDKNVRIGRDVVLTNPDGVEHLDLDPVYVREGVVVIRKEAVIPDGFCLSREPGYLAAVERQQEEPNGSARSPAGESPTKPVKG